MVRMTRRHLSWNHTSKLSSYHHLSNFRATPARRFGRQRMISVQQAPYTADLQWNRGPEVETLTHRFVEPCGYWGVAYLVVYYNSSYGRGDGYI
ncbi:hypothetical protein AVEN_75322-1 [Araneus ventricosus]|uniref:Uncharacterized protein n=1 Tax=Araneus ventricosus TaxID=182803 RepID=A0A4Y2PC79_ARAVE|nr:hypothetical protein AVEN_75322-1 [Araneus ventricosus]